MTDTEPRCSHTGIQSLQTKLCGYSGSPTRSGNNISPHTRNKLLAKCSESEARRHGITRRCDVCRKHDVSVARLSHCSLGPACTTCNVLQPLVISIAAE